MGFRASGLNFRVKGSGAPLNLPLLLRHFTEGFAPEFHKVLCKA